MFYNHENVNYFWTTSAWVRIAKYYSSVYVNLVSVILVSLTTYIKVYLPAALFEVRKLKGDAVSFVFAIFVVCFVDALITDDEPLFEPVEWSLTQSWVMLIFGLA